MGAGPKKSSPAFVLMVTTNRDGNWKSSQGKNELKVQLPDKDSVRKTETGERSKAPETGLLHATPEPQGPGPG